MNAEDCKVGDVALIKNRRGIPYSTAKIERVTETQIATEGGRRFMRRSGREIGGSDGTIFPSAWFPESHEVTIAEAEAENEKYRAEARRLRLAYEIEDIRWRELDMTRLDAIAKIVEPELKKNAEAKKS